MVGEGASAVKAGKGGDGVADFSKDTTDIHVVSLTVGAGWQVLHFLRNVAGVGRGFMCSCWVVAV